MIILLNAESNSCDTQDGYYGPTLTVGSPVIKGIRKHFPDYVIICHMLVEKPAL